MQYYQKQVKYIGCNQKTKNTGELSDDIDISKVKEIGTQIGKIEIDCDTKNLKVKKVVQNWEETTWK